MIKCKVNTNKKWFYVKNTFINFNANCFMYFDIIISGQIFSKITYIHTFFNIKIHLINVVSLIEVPSIV